MKERFSVTLDDELLNWIESLTEKKVFASRVHAIEFCVARIREIGIENTMLMGFGKKEMTPVFLPKKDIQTIEKVSTKLNVDKDEALKILIYRGLEEISRCPQTKDEIEKEKIYFK